MTSDFEHSDPIELRADYYRLRVAGYPVSIQHFCDGREYLHVPAGIVDMALAVLSGPKSADQLLADFLPR